MQATVALVGGKLPWDVAIEIPEELIDGWLIACATYHRGEEFDWSKRRDGSYVGFPEHKTP